MDMAMSMSVPSSTASDASPSATGMAMSPTAMTMPMVFYISTTTPLWSSAWTPTTTAQYAGTCIFLVAFGALFRGLVAVRVGVYALVAKFRAWRAGSFAYGYGYADGSAGSGEEGEEVGEGKTATPRTATTAPATTTGMKKRKGKWKAGDAIVVAALDVLVAGVSYLLMLAVMTFNVGYFLSVLAGVFLGSLAFGHFLSGTVAH